MKDILTALENWKKTLIVSPFEDLSDPVVKKRLSEIDKNAREALELFDRDSSQSLFLGRMPENTDEMVWEFKQIALMAVAWGSFGSAYYQDKQILEKILFSLEFMYQNRYGQKEIDGVGWRDIRLFNWHRWDIDSPQHIMHTLIILGDLVSPEEAGRFLKLFDHKVKAPRDFASNKVHYAKLIIGSGLLQRQKEKIELAVEAIKDTYAYVDDGSNNGQGFYTDGSYIFHTAHAMNGLYGQIHFSCLINISQILKNTSYYDPELEKKMCMWAQQAFIPFLSKGIVSASVLGRYPTVTSINGRKIMACICELAVNAPQPHRSVLLGDVKRNILNSDYLKKESARIAFYSTLSGDAYKLIKEVISDPCFAAREYDVSHVFHNSDRAVHHFRDVSYSLAMSSSRVFSYESINSMNMDGWYLCDGMLTAYSTDYYAYPDSWKKCDPYRRPGTTIDLRPRQLVSVAQKNGYLSSKDFVGGASNGSASVAAMELESFHSDGVGRITPRDLSYGGAPEARDCTLTAKKAWFFSKNIAVCLGCDINANDGARVITVADARMTASPLKIPQVCQISLTEEETPLPKGTDTLYIEGFGGYYFPCDSEITVCRGGKDGAFIHIVFDHGVSPKSQTYAYALLPTLSEGQTQEFSKSPCFRILSNTPSVQAVEFESGEKMYVFWSAGEFDGIKTSHPQIIMIANGTLYAADPTHKLQSAVAEICGRQYLFDHSGKNGATLSLSMD